MGALNLPEGIEINILSRLGVKSLMQFRCVSKAANSLICHPYFIKFHLNRSINSPKIITTCYYPPRFLDYESLFIDANIAHDTVKLDGPLCSIGLNFVGSCNGLICYVVRRFEFIIYNPFTRLYNQLPKPYITPSVKFYAYYFCEFGLDSNHNDYKVVVGTRSTFSVPNITFCVFSLTHNSWTIIQTLCCTPAQQSLFSSATFFLDGVLYWVPLTRDPNSRLCQWVLLSFDLSKEVFSEMPLDGDGIPSSSIFVWVPRMGSSEGGLYSLSRVDGGSVGLSLIKGIGGKGFWSKFIAIPCEGRIWVHPLCFLRNGELLVKIFGSELPPHPKTKLATYNIKENAFTKSCVCSPLLTKSLYVESLVSPISMHENDKVEPIATTLCRSRSHSCGKKARTKRR